MLGGRGGWVVGGAWTKILSNTGSIQFERLPASVYQTEAKSPSPRLYQPLTCSAPHFWALVICWKVPPSTISTVALMPMLASMPAAALQMSVSETYLPFNVVIVTGVLKS